MSAADFHQQITTNDLDYISARLVLSRKKTIDDLVHSVQPVVELLHSHENQSKAS